MKIAVLGAGALGCAMGSCLCEAGHEVWLINRNANHVDAMNRDGLTVRIQCADRQIRVRAARHAQDIAAQTGSVDLVIVLVKSFHTREAILSATAIVGPRTVVLSLQNGLGHEDVLAEVVGREKVVAGKTYAGGVMLGPGHIIRGTEGKETCIGELDGQVTERIQRIADVFNAAGLITRISDDIMGTMWEKLLVNVATGALSGITHLSYGDLYQVPEVKDCALAAVQEAMEVARANGIRLNVRDPEESWIKAAAGLPAEFKASMLQSLEKGSITEVDYVNGSVVRWGRQCGVPTPVNQTLVACLKGIERGLPA
ncbi:MAG TPA: 2-dehydropantoate 2-reductase [Burkholderiaceae bacterium]|nr:2-dehydropantoate 2-reductase [Burkholderiaceae bacterium]